MLAYCDGCATWTTVEPGDDGSVEVGPVQRCSDCRNEREGPFAAVRSLVPI